MGIPPGVSGLWAAANLEHWPPALEVRTPPSGGRSLPHDSSSRFSWSRRSSLMQLCGEVHTARRGPPGLLPTHGQEPGHNVANAHQVPSCGDGSRRPRDERSLERRPLEVPL